MTTRRQLGLLMLVFLPTLAAAPILDPPTKATFLYTWTFTAGSKVDRSGIVSSDMPQAKIADDVADVRESGSVPLAASSGGSIKSFVGASPVASASGATDLGGLNGSYDVTTEIDYFYKIVPLHSLPPLNLFGRVTFSYDYLLSTARGGKADVTISLPTERVFIHPTSPDTSDHVPGSEIFDRFTSVSAVGVDVPVKLIAHVSGGGSGGNLDINSGAFIDPIFSLSDQDAQNFAIIFSPNLYPGGVIPDLPDEGPITPEPGSFFLMSTGTLLFLGIIFRRSKRERICGEAL